MFKMQYLSIHCKENTLFMKQALTKVFNTCLELADAKGYKSIAFPALGTGNLKYPGREVSKCMFETATEWGLKKKAKSLHVIKFVLYARNHDLVQVSVILTYLKLDQHNFISPEKV